MSNLERGVKGHVAKSYKIRRNYRLPSAWWKTVVVTEVFKSDFVF